MSYEYLDEKRAEDTYALPDVEVWEDDIREVECSRCGLGEIPNELSNSGLVDCPSCESHQYVKDDYLHPEGRTGFFYAYGSPGYLWDSGFYGPFDTYRKAIEDARENAGIYDG